MTKYVNPIYRIYCTCMQQPVMQKFCLRREAKFSVVAVKKRCYKEKTSLKNSPKRVVGKKRRLIGKKRRFNRTARREFVQKYPSDITKTQLVKS